MQKLEEVVKIFNQGGIVIFPTDTAFGIGCRLDNLVAIERLFKLRRRPETKATPVLVDSREMAIRYWMQINSKVEDLISKYWPGALTIVCESKVDLVPELVRGGGQNVGLRMPDNEEILKIINLIGVGVLGPSANFHGAPTPYRYADIDSELIKLVDAVMEGECRGNGRASSVVDCTMLPFKIIRKGKINI